MLIQRARDTTARVAFCNHVGGQDELVFDGHSLSSTTTARSSPRAPQFEEELAPRRRSTSRRPRAARLRDPRHRPAARVRARARCRRWPARAAARPAADAGPPAAPSRRCSRRSPRSTPRSCLGLRDYVEKNGFRRVVLGLSGGIDSALVAAVAVDALGPDRVTRVDHALPVLLEPAPRATPARSPTASAPSGRVRHRAVMARLRRDARRAVRGPRARPHRGEPPGAHPRQPADGALEQVRLARAHDRQQVRAVGRLLDPLRRHRGRLRGHQGRARRRSSTPRRAAQRGAGRRRSRLDHRPPAEAELRPDQRDEDSLPPYDRSTRSSRATSRTTSTREAARSPAARPRRTSTA